MLKLKNRYLPLVCLLLCIPVLMGLSCATAQSRDDVENEITRIIGQWQEEYQNSEGWLFSARHVDAPEVHGIPGGDVISHLDALQIALEYIAESYPELSLDDLAQMNYPFFSYRIDTAPRQWQIDLMQVKPVDGADVFTFYLDAESGEILHAIYGPAHG